jgi:hypothetical protein
MSGYDVPKESLEEREERFRYVEKTHPLIDVLFKMGLDETDAEKTE